MQVQPAPPGYGAPPPPPQYGAPPMAPQPAATSVVIAQAPTTQVVVQQAPSNVYVPSNTTEARRFFRESPVRTLCPSCQSEVVTSIHYEIGTFTFVCAGLLIFFGLWLGCCIIPFFLNYCKDVLHSCPRCGHGIGRYNRV